MRVRAFHGLLPQERIVGNDFSVSVTLTIDAGPFIKSCINDCPELESTIDYSIISDTIKNEMAKPTPLLESVAVSIKQSLIEKISSDILHGEVIIKKITPPLGVQCGGASVALEW